LSLWNKEKKSLMVLIDAITGTCRTCRNIGAQFLLAYESETETIALPVPGILKLKKQRISLGAIYLLVFLPTLTGVSMLYGPSTSL
jgi:hypothetical protein